MKHLDLFTVLILVAMFAFGMFGSIAALPHLASFPSFDAIAKFFVVALYWLFFAIAAYGAYKKHTDPYWR